MFCRLRLRLGMAWRGQARQGLAWQGAAWPGMAGRDVLSILAGRGMARRGAAWPGAARRGEARHGEAGISQKGERAMKLAIDKIVIDETVYPRNGLSEFNIQRLMLAGEAGAQFPPIVVESRTHRLVDGRHRLEVYRRQNITKIEVIQKTYASDADLFADSVRLNIGHGTPLDQYTIRNAVLRLEQYGYKREQISEVVRLPLEKIEKIERGFANAPDGQPIALKGGLSHLHGETLSKDQQALNRRYSGGKATFHLRQLCALLERDMWPRSGAFEHEMERLIELWRGIKGAGESTAA
jgi:hypothetical protein